MLQAFIGSIKAYQVLNSGKKLGVVIWFPGEDHWG